MMATHAPLAPLFLASLLLIGVTLSAGDIGGVKVSGPKSCRLEHKACNEGYDDHVQMFEDQANFSQCVNSCHDIYAGYYTYYGETRRCYCYETCTDLTAVGVAVAGKVKACLGAGWEGEPHFIGAHGTRFDFNGELGKSYCLVTDRDLHINGLFNGYYAYPHNRGLRTWIKELGIFWHDGTGKSHTLHLVARNGPDAARGTGFISFATLDGVSFPVPATIGATFDKDDLHLTLTRSDNSAAYGQDVDYFSLVIDGRVDIGLVVRSAHPVLRWPGEAHVHLNVNFDNLKASDKVHGVLGQTFRNTPSQLVKAMEYSTVTKILRAPIKADEASGAGFLDGATSDYAASSVFRPDCKFSSFLM